MLLGPGEGNIQTPFAAGLVDGAEVHEHLAGGIVAVADADDDHVAFVSLDVLQVLDEQADELAVDFAFPFRFELRLELGIIGGQVAQGPLDLALLGLGEGDDADRQLVIARTTTPW